MTLDELLKAGVTTIAREQATMVPPAYRALPKDKQVEKPVRDIDKVLLSSEKEVFVCCYGANGKVCGEVFDTAAGASSHKNSAHAASVAKKRASVRATKAAQTRRLETGYAALEKALAERTTAYQELENSFHTLAARYTEAEAKTPRVKDWDKYKKLEGQYKKLEEQYNQAMEELKRLREGQAPIATDEELQSFNPYLVIKVMSPVRQLEFLRALVDVWTTTGWDALAEKAKKYDIIQQQFQS